MDFNVMLNSVQSALGGQVPAILGAIAILVLGYLIAVVVRAVLNRTTGAMGLNKRLHAVGIAVNVERSVGKVGFWLVMLGTLIGVFNALNLEQVSGPLAGMLSQITAYLPHLLAGLVLAVLAWVVASLVRGVVNKAMTTSRLGQRLTAEAGDAPLSGKVGQGLFWLVILLFMPAILGAFQLDGLLGPVRNMVDQLVGMLPNVLGALAIVLVGWLVAKILRGLVSNLVAASGVDRLGQSAERESSVEISKLVGWVVFAAVFVPALIAGLDALKITAISEPATQMLASIMTALPNILAAGLILVVTWFVARLVGDLIGRILASTGIDLLPQKMGLSSITNGKRISDVAPKLVVFFAMLFAATEAAHRLSFVQLEQALARFVQFGGQVLLGCFILAIGFWLANLAYTAILRVSGDDSKPMADIVRVAILGLVLAMGLSAMGIAPEIVTMAFALVLGAIAVAIALAFGLGGREAAGKQMEYWLSRWRK